MATADELFDAALIVGLVTGATCLLCLGYFAFESSASRNIGIATGTLVGAATIFILQILFELQPSESNEFIATEYTVDRSVPTIVARQPFERWGLETRGLQALSLNVGQFNGDRQALMRHFTVFSLVGYLGSQQFDWQIKRTTFQTHSGKMSTAGFQSSSAECGKITKAEVQSKLAEAYNPFALAQPFMFDHICLPPNSILEVRADGITIRNPFCSISFKIEMSGAVFYGTPLPEGGFGHVEKLPGGDARFETSAVGIRVSVHFNGLRAQHRRMRKYRDWSERLVAGAIDWFADREPMIIR